VLRVTRRFKPFSPTEQNDEESHGVLGWPICHLLLTGAVAPTILAPFCRQITTGSSMKKSTTRNGSAKKARDLQSAKRTAAKRARLRRTESSPPVDTNGKLTFNHAMIYVKEEAIRPDHVEVLCDAAKSTWLIRKSFAAWLRRGRKVRRV
jgi:hypothetical protein